MVVPEEFYPALIFKETGTKNGKLLFEMTTRTLSDQFHKKLKDEGKLEALWLLMRRNGESPEENEAHMKSMRPQGQI